MGVIVIGVIQRPGSRFQGFSNSNTQYSNTRITTPSVQMSNTVNLREKYRENASLFLYLANQVAGKNTESETHRQQRQIFNPLSTSQSLVLRSRYEETLNGSVNDTIRGRCISQSEKICSLETVNLIRSGGKPATMDFETCQDAIKNLSKDKELIIDCVRNQSTNKMLKTEKIKMLSTLLSNGIVIQTTNNDSQNATNSDFVCSSCGSNLLPVHQSDLLGSRIKIKSLSRRSSSMRRRASRYVAKRHNFESNIIQKQRGGGRTFSNASTNSHGAAVSNVMETFVALKKNHDQYRVYDGLAKNVIIYKCNTCNHEKVVKGAPFCGKFQQEMGKLEMECTGKPQLRVSNKAKHDCRVENPISLNEEKDFLSFGTTSVETPLPRCLSTKPKKKKKVDTPKKSELQSFLSSLND